MTSLSVTRFDARTDDTLGMLERSGQLKLLQTITGPMDASIRLRDENGGEREVLCFCSNNYLGLAN
ncbi:MAG: hypothetical protein AAFU70_05960, partial [Planctomycetota bacterium]